VETDICISFSENIGFSRKYGSCQMETNLCSSLSKTFASLVNIEAVRMEMDVCISLSKNICSSCKYGSCQDGDGCIYVLVLQKSFASVINMEAVRIEMDICVSLPESIVLSRKYGRCQMETDVEYWRFRKHLLHLKLWTLSGWRRVYSISLS